MKKLLLFLFVFVPVLSFSQGYDENPSQKEAGRKAKNAEKLEHVLTPQPEVMYEYCEVIRKPKFNTRKIAVQIDFGQEIEIFESAQLKDENGKSMEFNSMIEVLNYMGSLGWEFVQAYVVVLSDDSIVHYVLKRRKATPAAAQ